VPWTTAGRRVKRRIPGGGVFAVCSERLGDPEQLMGAYRRWAWSYPEKLDEAL